MLVSVQQKAVTAGLIQLEISAALEALSLSEGHFGVTVRFPGKVELDSRAGRWVVIPAAARRGAVVNRWNRVP